MPEKKQRRARISLSLEEIVEQVHDLGSPSINAPAEEWSAWLHKHADEPQPFLIRYVADLLIGKIERRGRKRKPSGVIRLKVERRLECMKAEGDKRPIRLLLEDIGRELGEPASRVEKIYYPRTRRARRRNDA